MSVDNVYEMKKNGVSCLNYGIHVLSQPPIISPRERIEAITIPGRTGTLTQKQAEEVHDPITLSVTCIIDNTDNNRIQNIVSWISGYGEYEFYGHGDGFYKGYLSSQMSFDRLVQGNPHKGFSFQFECQPYFYYNSGKTTVTLNGTGVKTLTNPGNVFSKPLLKVYGSGQGTIMCGSSTMLINDIGSSGGYIVLDCDAELAYTENPMTLVGTRVSGDWLNIPAGTAYMTLAGGITSVVVTPRWRRK